MARYDDGVQLQIPTLLGISVVTKRSFYVEDDYPKEYKDTIKGISRVPGFIESLQIEEGTIEALDHMRSSGLFPVVCTALPGNHPTAEAEKREWVHKHLVPHLGPYILETMIITHDKFKVPGIAIIEDRPVIRGADEAFWTHIIFDQTWNQDAIGLRIPKWSNLALLDTALEQCRYNYQRKLANI